jgi:membrane protein
MTMTRLKRLFGFARKVWRDMSEDNLTLVAAGVAYYSLLALFPSIIAVVTVYALVADAQQVQEQIEPLLSGLPKDARDLLVTQLTRIVEKSDGGLSVGLAVSLLAAVWAASGGVQALMTGLNIITEQRETRNFLRLKATALGLTLGALVAAAVALGLIAVFPIALRWLGLGSADELVLQIVRWPLLVVLVATGLSVMYRYGPAPHAARWRWVSPGSTLAIALWIIASAGLSIYVSQFGKYDTTYGGLAGAVLLLLWLYLSAFAILLGAQVDSVRAGLLSPVAGSEPEKSSDSKEAIGR